MSNFRFESMPWLLLIVPLFAATYFATQYRQPPAIVFSSVSLLSGRPRTWMQKLRHSARWLRLAGAIFLVIALARPQYGIEAFRVRTSGIAIQMCLDRSASMLAMDFSLDGQQVTRLEAVKDVFHEFIGGGELLPGRPNDLVGLITFGGFVETKAPLTLDHVSVADVLQSVQVPERVKDSRGNTIAESFFAEEVATAIGDAVVAAVDRLKGTQAKSKVIILLSDGENTAGAVSPAEAAAVAKQFDVKIYSIGVGATGPAPFREQNELGDEVIVSHHVKLDEETLSMLAETTGGQYFHAADTAALQRVYADIDRLEKTEISGRAFTQYREFYLWFLVPGVLLIATDTLLNATRFRSLP